MELSQPRPFGTEGRKPTHDFLSLYPPAQQDPRPSSQGDCLKTHDFLQPLERVGKSITKEGDGTVATCSEKPPKPAPPPIVEHIPPGGIGTYSISHISYVDQSHQRVPKPEGITIPLAQSSGSDRNDENSNSSSYTGSGFTLWEESAVKGKAGKENIAGDRGEMAMNRGQLTASLERPSQPSSNYKHHTTTFSSLASSRLSSVQKSQNFTNLMKFAKAAQEEDDEDEEEELIVKKEPFSLHKVKLDAKGSDQKPNTPRSKHSATEQRRRSKINDRFLMLRQLIPHSDQKRDKASFLLEVIEYIQFLQEKVHKCEESFRGWNSASSKLLPWSNGDKLTEGFIDQHQISASISKPALAFATQYEKNKVIFASKFSKNSQSIVDSDVSSVGAIKKIDQQHSLTTTSSPFTFQLKPNVFSPDGSSNGTTQLTPRLLPVADDVASHPQSQLRQNKPCTTNCNVFSDKLKAQELTIESGTISISTVYSQGLLNTLTQALQSSGVDLSQASISVQIDLGNRANSAGLNSSTSVHKRNDVLSNDEELTHSTLAGTEGKTDGAFKRFKTSRD